MNDEEGIHEARFTALIYSLHSQAMVQLGKLAEPGSGEIKRDLNGARGTIDLLETLVWKVKRGAEQQELKALDGLLTELRLNFIDESGGGESTAEEPTEEDEAKDGGKDGSPEDAAGEMD